jgi:hypothetical protein
MRMRQRLATSLVAGIVTIGVYHEVTDPFFQHHAAKNVGAATLKATNRPASEQASVSHFNLAEGIGFGAIGATILLIGLTAQEDARTYKEITPSRFPVSPDKRKTD